jgi:hypothetical protein
MKYIIKRYNPDTETEEEIKQVSKLTDYAKEINVPIHIIRKQLKLCEHKIEQDPDKIYKCNDTYKDFYDTIKIYNIKRKF